MAKMKSEILLLSDYYNIIANLIDKFCFASITKIEIVSLLVKHYKDSNLLKDSASNRTRDFLSSFLTVLYSKNSDLLSINECLSLLERKKYIRIDGDKIVKEKEMPFIQDSYIDKSNVISVIELLSELSVESFVEDLIAYA